jgi:hypothetical protein
MATLGTWVSFADASKPKGQMFIGCIVVKASNPILAMFRIVELGLWPVSAALGDSLDVAMWPVDLNFFTDGEIERMPSEKEVHDLRKRNIVEGTIVEKRPKKTKPQGTRHE